jgi:hypothetical protein
MIASVGEPGMPARDAASVSRPQAIALVPSAATVAVRSMSARWLARINLRL